MQTKDCKEITINNFKDCYEDIIKKYIPTPTEIKEIDNPLFKPDSNVKCKLINKKKDKYYIHTYNPDINDYDLKLEDKKEEKELNEKYANELREVFDFTKREKCCNCVCIVLYSSGDEEYLRKTLVSIERTINVVATNLNNWITRFYVDYSVFNVIEKSTNNFLKEIFGRILKHEQVEIYTLLCDYTYEKNIGFTRTYRFLPMIDPEVNIAIIREADGVVSHIDAINIDRFEKKSKRIFYTNSLDYAYNIDKTSTFPRFLSYSKWLESYKKYIRYDLFNTHLNLLDLLAGTIGLRLKVKKDYYNKSVDFLRTKIENAKLDYAQYQDEEENIMDYLKDKIQNKHNKYVSKMKIYEVYKKYENDVLYTLTDPGKSNLDSNFSSPFGSPRGSPRQYSIPDSTENNTNNIHDEISELDDPLNNLLISDKSTYVGSNDDDDKEIDTIIHKELNERNKEEYQKFFHFSNATNINVFDELLLLDLFRNIISIKIKKKKMNHYICLMI